MRQCNGQRKKAQRKRSFSVTVKGLMFRVEGARRLEVNDIFILEPKHRLSVRVSCGGRTFRGNLVVIWPSPQGGFEDEIGIQLTSLDAKRGASSARA